MKNKKNNLFIRIFFLVMLFMLPSFAWAADYYVSPTGNADWSECTNISTPCSVQTAMTNAVAGDVVNFLDGTYNVGQQGDAYRIPVLNPSNSGTSENEITFKAQNKGLAIINGTIKEGEYNCSVIGANNRDYIIWDGFKITTNNGAYMATVNFQEGADHCAIQNSEIVGASHSTGGANNYEGIRVEDSSYILIDNCYVHGFIETSDNHNTSGYKNYRADYVTIQNCEFSNCTVGIYPKDGNNNIIIKNNYIHDCYMGLFIAADAGHGSTNIQVYNNLFANISYSTLGLNPSDYNLAGVSVYNNTIYNGGMGVGYTQTPDFKIYNNILASTSHQLTGTNCDAILAEEDHNQWGTSTFSIVMRNYCGTQATYSSLVSWQASSELYGGGHPGDGDLASDPLFINTSGNMNQVADFALASNSPCKGAGRNSTDMGADISLVGIDAGEESDTTPPSAPSGLSVS